MAVDWDVELTGARRDEIANDLAGRIVGRGMAGPAVLLLEMHRPLAGLAGQAIVLSSGLLAPVMGAHRLQELSKLFGSQENLQVLIERIESAAAVRARDERPV